jgi:hypothetical protein
MNSYFISYIDNATGAAGNCRHKQIEPITGPENIRLIEAEIQQRLQSLGPVSVQFWRTFEPEPKPKPLPPGSASTAPVHEEGA